MSRKKLYRFAELETYEHVGIGDMIPTKLSTFLSLDDIVTVELGCGRGEHTVALARQFPDQKFIGIDYQGERIWYGAKQTREENLPNALFLQFRGEQLTQYFLRHSVSQIILPFPDPFPKDRHEKRRLVSPCFLDIYATLLKPDGIVHLKTDDKDFFSYARNTLKTYPAHIIEYENDIPEKPHDFLLGIRTHYERKHRAHGKKIKYLKFRIS